MSKSRGNVMDPWESSARAAPTRCAGTSRPRARRGRPSASYLENIDETTNRFLVTLWNTYSFFATYANLDGWHPGARRAAAPDARDGPVDRGHGCTARCATVTEAFEDFDALRATQALDALRRRPLQLVRAAQPAAVLEGRRRHRARGAARVPRARSRCCSRRCARSSPTSCTRTSTAPTGRCTSPTGPAPTPPRSIPRSRPTWRSRASSSRSGSRPAPSRSCASANRCPRAIVLVPRDAAVPTRRRGRDRRRAQREADRDGDVARGPARLHRAPQLPRARAQGGQATAAREGAARRGRRRRRCRPRSTSTAEYVLDVDGEPDRAHRRRGADPCVVARGARARAGRSARGRARHRRSTTRLRREGLAREVVRALNDQRKAQGFEIADRIHVARRRRGRPRGGASPSTASWIAGEVLAPASSTSGLDGDARALALDGRAVRAAQRSPPEARAGLAAPAAEQTARGRPGRRGPARAGVARAERRLVGDRLPEAGEERVVVEVLGLGLRVEQRRPGGGRRRCLFPRQLGDGIGRRRSAGGSLDVATGGGRDGGEGRGLGRRDRRGGWCGRRLGDVGRRRRWRRRRGRGDAERGRRDRARRRRGSTAPPPRARAPVAGSGRGCTARRHGDGRGSGHLDVVGGRAGRRRHRALARQLLEVRLDRTPQAGPGSPARSARARRHRRRARRASHRARAPRSRAGAARSRPGDARWSRPRSSSSATSPPRRPGSGAPWPGPRRPPRRRPAGPGAASGGASPRSRASCRSRPHRPRRGRRGRAPGTRGPRSGPRPARAGRRRRRGCSRRTAPGCRCRGVPVASRPCAQS